jgi:REase_DpnII-MboI
MASSRSPEAPLFTLAARFDLVARQLLMRHCGRETLAIKDEYDVRDLLHALLAIFYDDIREEEWTPSYAGGASRMDFLLPEIGTVVETKMMRWSLSTRKLGEELVVDIDRHRKHPGCRTLFCLVYDPHGLVKNPRGLEGDLSGQRDKLAVRVMIVPTQS